MAAPPRGRRRGVLRRRRRTASTASRKSQRPLLLIRAKKKKKKKETLLKLSFFSFPSKFCYQGGKVGPAVQPVAKTLPPISFRCNQRRRPTPRHGALALPSPGVRRTRYVVQALSQEVFARRVSVFSLVQSNYNSDSSTMG